MGGFAWYRIDQEGLANQETFQQSVELLSHFLEEIKAGYPVNPGRLVLLGFSQGTVMAYALALLYPGSVRGIAALSGYVPHKSGLPLRLRQLDGFQVFISHGAHDEVIPVGFARESAELLRSAGADVVYHEYAMGHEVREATLRDLSVWMRKLLFLGPDGPIRSNT
jgi:phospholipase/carboxylesterase